MCGWSEGQTKASPPHKILRVPPHQQIERQDLVAAGQGWRLPMTGAMFRWRRRTTKDAKEYPPSRPLVNNRQLSSTCVG